ITMQGKGFITLIAVILGLICINELLPTWYSGKIERQATELSAGDPVKYQKEIERLSKDTLDLGFNKLYYTKAKEKEMKLGLDLKGVINVLLEFNQRDLMNTLPNYAKTQVLTEPVNKTDEVQKKITDFYNKIFFFLFDELKKEKKT